ncbi:MAG: hypothetical protein FWE38_04690 [Firmicutes bacterium]|nr:hypothetical protein [Bacillota bacterium]
MIEQFFNQMKRSRFVGPPEMGPESETDGEQESSKPKAPRRGKLAIPTGPGYNERMLNLARAALNLSDGTKPLGDLQAAITHLNSPDWMGKKWALYTIANAAGTASSISDHAPAM